jgi:SAM-dependent methyltransferase
MTLYTLTVAEAYARYRHVHPGVLTALLQGGAINARTRVLEVGCGTGNYLSAIRAQTGCPCWGIDPAAPMLTKAQAHRVDIAYAAARAEALPLPDTCMDVLFSVDMIHHVRDRRAYFAGARRVLRPGGRLCTVTDSEWIIRNRPLLSGYFPETVEPELRRYPPISSLCDEMAAAGLHVVDEQRVEHASVLTDISAFRAKSFSALHLIAQDAFECGLARLERDLQRGPIPTVSRYVLLWAAQT